MSADFAKALRGRKEIFVGISGVTNPGPRGAAASSEEHLSDPEIRDGFLTGLSADRGGPGDPLRLMIPLERVAYIAFWERKVEEEKVGEVKRVAIGRMKVEGAQSAK